MLLPDKVAIITGGARGMGKAIALAFAEEGCSAFIADVLDAEAEKTVEEVSQKGRSAVYLHCDVSDSHNVRDMVGKAISKYGKVDILVNCAGIGTKPTSLEETTEEEWDRVMDVNCKGTFLCIQAIASHMKKNRYGKIINIVSVAAFTSFGINCHYHASKAAQLSVSNCAAAALAPYNVCVNIIHPGMILTDMSAVFSGPEVKDVVAYQTEMAERIVPLKRLGTTTDVARAALFLASEESSYITGGSVCVSGGAGLFMPGPAEPPGQ